MEGKGKEGILLGIYVVDASLCGNCTKGGQLRAFTFLYYMRDCKFNSLPRIYY